jgi:predicted nuclease of predicted toxin-antitoxin system
MKILIDMNLSPLWVDTFAKHAIEAVHWSSVGDPRATDRTIMEWASINGYIVFTHDLDFGALLAATQASSPSVIQVRTQDVLPDQLEAIIINVINQFQTSLETGALVTVDKTRSRVRILPFS